MIIIPTLFGSQILHNGTTHFATKSLMPAPEAALNLVLLANGTWHDPYGTTNKAPLTPGKLTATIAIALATEAALNAEINAIFNLIGTRNLLSVKSLDNSIDNCQARMEKVKLIHPFNIVSGSKTKIEILFQCITPLTP